MLACPSPTVPPPASRWGASGPSAPHCVWGTPPAPHVGPCSPLLGPRGVALSCLSSLWGALAAHSQMVTFKSRPSSHPSGFPCPALRPANGAHVCGRADGDRRGHQGREGASQGAVAMEGTVREPAGKAEAGGTPSEREGPPRAAAWHWDARRG